MARLVIRSPFLVTKSAAGSSAFVFGWANESRTERYFLSASWHFDPMGTIRSFDPLPPDDYLLSRPHGKTALIRQLRYYLHEVSAAAGIPTRIVPHQLRHYAGFRTIPGEGSMCGRKARQC